MMFVEKKKGSASAKASADKVPLKKLLHKTIKKVSEDIELMKFNTAVSSLMILLNKIEKENEISKNKDVKHLQVVEDLIKKYGLAEFVNYYPHELSGGMRQRVALIRTLAINPKILLLDEPFTALDFQTRLEVCDDVSNIISSEHKTAIFVTHDIGEAISIADKVIVLTKRPAQVKRVFDINLSHLGLPLKRRENAEFTVLFDLIYKELKK